MQQPFVPTDAAPTKELVLPTGNGQTYARLTLELDVTHAGWYAPKPDGAHGIFQLTRSKKWGSNLYGFMTWRGPPSKLIRVNSNIDQAPGVILQLQTNKLLQAGTKYHVKYTYDGPTQTRSLLVTDAGQAVVDIQKQDAASEVTTLTPGFDLILATALNCSGCGPEVPTIGWTYENVCLQLDP